MTERKHLYLILGLAMLLVGGIAFAGTSIIVDSTSATDPAPTVQIVVHDGNTSVVAGCSEPDCMGSPSTAAQVTGTVTHSKNYVYWMIDYGNLPIDLYCDGTLVYSQSRVKAIIWTTTRLSAGSHTLVATAYNSAGVMGSSTPLTITVIK